ncbi:MATE family efflux transporter [Anaerotignum propionicum]|uniref:MATE family efflux transporter n=1 Tax=Anaerotignum propionicum TaxID=28446 RepID=UPI00289A165E|nr:MATE family efflux transporter [Anaerotignum propionicum]
MKHEVRDYFTSKMFRRQFAPALISAVGLAVGDMADAIVVGQRMGVTGLAAISLALPVFMVINVLMHGFGIGGSIRFSTLLANGKKEEGVRGFQGLLGVAVCISILLSAIGILFLPQLLAVLGTTAADGDLYAVSHTYVQIILLGMPIFFISYISNYYLRNDDNQRLASFGFTVGNLSDIALNIVFVLIMDFGAAGAAWATVCGQIISIYLYLPGLGCRSGALQIFPFRPDFKGTFACLRIGFSSSVQYLFSMLFLLISNNVLLRLSGDLGVAVFDMVQNASFLILYLYDGTAKASQPLVSTFCGEYNDTGKRRTLKLGLCWGTAVGSTAMLLVVLFPHMVCHLFGLTDSATMDMGVYALRIFCLSTGFAGVSILLEGYYQACGEEKNSLILATLRGGVVLIPVTLLMSVMGISAFWWLFPVTECLSLFIFLLWHKLRRKAQMGFDATRICTRTIQSKKEELAPLIEELNRFCERWDANVKQRYFVTMAVEELCTAIKTKAFDNANGYIQLTVVAQEDGMFALHLRDNAVSFNPFSLQTEKVSDGDNYDMDAMGVLVVREKAKEFFYRRYQGFNTLVVKI